MDTRQEMWVHEHFGPNARVSGDCSCGRKLTNAEYSYHGGTFGYYNCPDCHQEWEVDLNGAMWLKDNPPVQSREA